MSNSTDDYGEHVDPWDITLVDDLMVHCHEHFPVSFDELYVDMLSACASGTSARESDTHVPS